MPTDLKVLSIGLDDTLLVDESLARGDAAARQRQYAQRLGRLDMVVFTRRGGAPPQRELSSNAWAYGTGSSHSLSYVRDALRLSESIRCQYGAPDIVTTQDPFLTGWTGYMLRRRWGVGLNVQLFSSFLDNLRWLSERPANRLFNRLGKFIVRAADTVRVESVVEKQHLVSLGVPTARVWVIPLLYDFRRFERADGAAIRARYMDATYREMVLFVGRLAPEKDIPTLLRAVPLLAQKRPEARIVIVGEGRQDSNLQGLASEMGLGARVVFAGGVGSEQLPSYFHACDVLALPSNYEGIPTVLVEAAASAKPVVSTRTRNVEDVVQDGQTGYIVPVRDPVALAEALARVLADPARSAQMGRAGREWVLARFAPDKVMTDLLAMWRATADCAQVRLKTKGTGASQAEA
jgi:glycosyltransferase involved in cell wall biosynthesis